MSKEVLELCTEFCNKGVIGIDLAGLETETDPTPQEIISVFKVRWNPLSVSLMLWAGSK